MCPCRLGARARGEGGFGGGGQSVQMEAGVRGGNGGGKRVWEGRAARACLAWTSEVGTLHCLFNREQISKTIEAHQSFELGWVRRGWSGGAAANVEEISNFLRELLAQGFVTKQRME